MLLGPRFEDQIGRRLRGAIVWWEDGSGKKRVSAAAVGTGIAAVELLDVELLRRKRGARAGLRAWRMKIAFVGGIAAPFAEAAPEAAERARDGFWNARHQSSP